MLQVWYVLHQFMDYSVNKVVISANKVPMASSSALVPSVAIFTSIPTSSSSVGRNNLYALVSR